MGICCSWLLRDMGFMDTMGTEDEVSGEHKIGGNINIDPQKKRGTLKGLGLPWKSRDWD